MFFFPAVLNEVKTYIRSCSLFFVDIKRSNDSRLAGNTGYTAHCGVVFNCFFIVRCLFRRQNNNSIQQYSVLHLEDYYRIESALFCQSHYVFIDY